MEQACLEIDAPEVLGYQAMSQNAFWATCADLPGAHILGIAFHENGLPREDRVLVVELDPYFTEADWLRYQGDRYFIDLDIYTVRGVTADRDLPSELYPVSLAYYLKYDSYLPSKDHPFVSHYQGLSGQSS